jgi:hypothetical protein
MIKNSPKAAENIAKPQKTALPEISVAPMMDGANL